MFEGFNDAARSVIYLAQEEAKKLKHNYIGTEHLLLGFFQVDNDIAVHAFAALGVSYEDVSMRIQDRIGLGDFKPVGYLVIVPRLKEVIELSRRQALQLGHYYIGTEHLLLAVVRDYECEAAQILIQLEVDLAQIRTEVLQLLATYAREQSQAGATDEMSIKEWVESTENRFREAAEVCRREADALNQEAALMEKWRDWLAHIRTGMSGAPTN